MNCLVSSTQQPESGRTVCNLFLKFSFTIQTNENTQVSYLRNKFNFSEVHGSMNAMDLVLKKWRPWTSEKWNSSLIFILCFYIVFVHYLWNFDLSLANKRRRKVIIRRVWLLRSTAVTMTWCQLNVTSASQLLHLSIIRLCVTSRNVAWTSVVHGFEPCRSKIVSSKEIVDKNKYSKMTSIHHWIGSQRSDHHTDNCSCTLSYDFPPQVYFLWSWETWPTWPPTDPSGLSWMVTLIPCGLSPWILWWTTTRCWHWPVTRESLSLRPWDCCLRSVISERPLPLLCLELVSCSSTQLI